MRLLRGLLGCLLWVLAAVLGLVSLLLCLTIILLPLGIPLLRAAKSLFARSVRLMLPPAVAHPVKETRRKGRRLLPDQPDVSGKAKETTRKARKKVRKKTRKIRGRRRRLLP